MYNRTNHIIDLSDSSISNKGFSLSLTQDGTHNGGTKYTGSTKIHKEIEFIWEGIASPGFKQIQVALEQNQNDMYIHWYSDTIPNAGSGTTSRPNSRIYLTNRSAPVGRSKISDLELGT